jgi:hypothetical protein
MKKTSGTGTVVKMATDSMGNLSITGHGMDMLIIETPNTNWGRYNRYTVVTSTGVTCIVDSSWDLEREITEETPDDQKLIMYLYGLAINHFDYVRPVPEPPVETVVTDIDPADNDRSIVPSDNETGLSRVE